MMTEKYSVEEDFLMRNDYHDVISGSTRSGQGINENLRAYMVQVFIYMGLALAISGLTAFGVMSSPALMQMVMKGGMLLMLAPLGIAIYFSVRIHKLSYQTAKTIFFVYSALMGVSLSLILCMFTMISVAQTFFLTAGLFGAMALYGYTTKKDLTAMGSFLIMGLFGIIIAGIVNIFLGSSVLQLLTSVLGVIIFTGLTAYDVQRIREFYVESDDQEVIQKKALLGAFSLYLNFINLFIRLLSIFGDRR